MRFMLSRIVCRRQGSAIRIVGKACRQNARIGSKIVGDGLTAACGCARYDGYNF